MSYAVAAVSPNLDVANAAVPAFGVVRGACYSINPLWLRPTAPLLLRPCLWHGPGIHTWRHGPGMLTWAWHACMGLACTHGALSGAQREQACLAAAAAVQINLFFAGFLIRIDNIGWWWRWYSYLNFVRWVSSAQAVRSAAC